MYIIEINNLNFDYSSKVLFSNLDLKIEENIINNWKENVRMI